jgi:hypothetical protein
VLEFRFRFHQFSFITSGARITSLKGGNEGICSISRRPRISEVGDFEGKDKTPFNFSAGRRLLPPGM